METSDPAEFWREIRSLLGSGGDMTEYIDRDDWFNHFNNLDKILKKLDLALNKQTAGKYVAAVVSKIAPISELGVVQL